MKRKFNLGRNFIFEESLTSEGAVFTIETSVLGSRKTPAGHWLLVADVDDGDDVADVADGDDGDGDDDGVDLQVEGMAWLVASLKEGRGLSLPGNRALVLDGVLVAL